MSILTYPLTLQDLPSPPPGKMGWPWTEATAPLPENAPNGLTWPRISIVTPSYNQVEFLEETMRSILLQGYPNLEYIIIDGGSNDGSIEIIKKYAPFLAAWVSEPDGGQSQALNKGFRKATGELIGWQNSDDSYQPQAFIYAAKKLLAYPDVDVIYGKIDHLDQHSCFIESYPVLDSITIENMMPYSSVTNHSVFYRNKIFQNNEFIDENFKHCMDQEFHLRLLLKGYQFTFEPGIKANWRVHHQSKSSRQMQIWASEAFKLYQWVYSYPQVSPVVKTKAKSCLYGLCLDNFAKGRVQLFRESVQVLFRLFGWQGLTVGIMFKYMLSWLGENNIDRLFSLKARALLIFNKQSN